MKIYFTASFAGKKHYFDNYLAIINHLKSKGYEVQADHILKISENQVHLQSRDTRIKFHAQLLRWITSADFMVTETSFPSISVGYEISLAIQSRNPVFILFTEGEAPSLFAFHSDALVVCEKYTLSSLPKIIDDFIRYIHGAT